MTADLRVFVVEDDQLTASLHGEYVRRVPGFTLVGTAHTRREAVAALLPDGARAEPGSRPPADLVLLDMNLPDGHGLAICRMLRAAGAGIDVLAITAATELPVVREAIALGVVQYLIKPFGFAAFEEKLLAYAAFRSTLTAGAVDGGATQDAVDAALTRLRGARAPGAAVPPAADDGASRAVRTPSPLPKGLSETTLSQVAELLAGSTEALSATEVHTGTGISRVTARRYLEYLAAVGRVEKEARYGTPGRPEMGYRWHP
ncbi:transcriptional regulatory protein [Tersicoccus solisilvae]|uniref:Transcriptional regulatory protein n=1 Tax=Tersicoccus solisilvae TaxID=1882339 RepID=A0ABQ1NSD1_9MICC|nr:response regulator [Tersicoccus solisilvae]GGC83790.1 transcriptional regulatory protein [Tersicoccus solisilvae]